MVNHKNKILDEGKLKDVCEVSMSTKDSSYMLFQATKYKTKQKSVWVDDRLLDETIQNDKFIEMTPRIKWADEKVIEYIQEWDYVNWPKGPDMNKMDGRFETWCGGKDVLYNYLGIKPFYASVMINISPDWDGEGIKRSNNSKMVILSSIVEQYLKEGWYSKSSYIIENGGEGDHIHAHIVAEFSPGRLKSTNAHLTKGNHTIQLKKYAKKVKGMEGIIKGPGVHKVFLRTKELVDDKLKYLIEEEKPEGHKNHSKMMEVKELVF